MWSGSTVCVRVCVGVCACVSVCEPQFPHHLLNTSCSSLEDDNGGDEEWSGDKLHGIHDAVRSDVPSFQWGKGTNPDNYLFTFQIFLFTQLFLSFLGKIIRRSPLLSDIRAPEQRSFKSAFQFLLVYWKLFWFNTMKLNKTIRWFSFFSNYTLACPTCIFA